jgi:exopolyphosphatase/guanosine-5'-triphosphate,3'-diphosphate pyrophosphatase
VKVAVADIGSNSTRLLVAEVDGDDGSLEELDRRSVVTRLGQGVESSGALAEEAQARVFSVLDDFAPALEGCDRRLAVLTSAVRDADNGAKFADAVRERYGLDARTLSGDEEAHLTFLGATAARDRDDPTQLLVIDIGGGSTELVVGAHGEVDFHVSTQAGVVRHAERHLHTDPPAPDEMRALAADVREILENSVPGSVRERVEAAVAVAGTPTQVAAIDLVLEPYDASRVEGYVVSTSRLAEIRATLAALPLEERRKVPGLHPDRAPTIVAGTIVLGEVLEAFGLGAFEVSERDILWGVALDGAL